MNKLLKRSLALISVVILCFAVLTACGQDSDAVVGAVGEATGAFRMGGTGPLTGGAAIYGNAVANGAQIAVDEINARGGEIQFDLRYEDDEHNAERAVNAYNALKDWGMQVFLGSVTSTPAVATAEESNQDRVFFMTPSASSTEVLGGVPNPLTGIVSSPRRDNVFQMCFVDPNQGLYSAQYIYDHNLAERIAVIYKNDDVYSMGIFDSFIQRAGELGLEIVSTTTFTEANQNDFSVQLTDARNSEADLVFLPMYYTPASLILAQARGMDFAPRFFGVDGMDGILTMEGFDPSLAEGVMLLTPFTADAEDERTVNFVTMYYERFGEIPNQFAAGGYDTVHAIYTALNQVNATTDMSAEEISELLIPIFSDGSFVFSGVTGENMRWDETGAVAKSPRGIVIQDGVYVGME